MTYEQLSTQAASLERKHDFVNARNAWLKATEIAGPKNKVFAENRSEFCDTCVNRGWK